MKPQLIRTLVSEYNRMAEAYNLSPHHRVEHDARSAAFAKHYVAGHKRMHTPLTPTAKHEKDAEHFDSTYSVDHVRSGFGGSGTSVYTHKATGHRFQVNRTSSGKGFYGTNHNIKTL